MAFRYRLQADFAFEVATNLRLLNSTVNFGTCLNLRRIERFGRLSAEVQKRPCDSMVRICSRAESCIEAQAAAISCRHTPGDHAKAD